MYIEFKNKTIKVNNMNTYLKRLKGLMFKKSIPEEIFYFPNCNNIHTFFMKQEITVIMLDKNYKVIEIKNMKPNKILINKNAKHTLEIPTTLKKYFNSNEKITIK